MWSRTLASGLSGDADALPIRANARVVAASLAAGQSAEYHIAAGRKVRRIRNILWVSPLTVQNGVPNEVFIELKPSGDTVTFDGVDRIKSDHKSSTADMGIGVVAQLSSTVSVYMEGNYGTQLDDNNFEGVSGNLGVRVRW